jgi:hypothetical protein
VASDATWRPSRLHYGAWQKVSTQEEEEKLVQYIISSRFIQNFRRRHRLSLLRPILKRRLITTDVQINAFVQRMRSMMASYLRERIINVDETNWRVVAAGFLTWRKTAMESAACQIDNDAKQGVTIIAAIDRLGGKLPFPNSGWERENQKMSHWIPTPR